MENLIWAAVAVALVVLIKKVWDIYQSNRNGNASAELADYVQVDGLPVVPRSQRHGLTAPAAVAPVAEPVVNLNELERTFAANEELETSRRFAEPVAANVVALADHLPERAIEDELAGDDDFVDAVAMSASQSKVVEGQEYIIVYVTSGRVPFDGERLLKSVSGFGLRFGEMSMFHRHEHPNGHGQVLFSMARVDDVGAFDLETMGSEFISAVTLFMALPSQQPYLAYDMMIDTAKRLAHEFNGQVLDQNHNALNRQLIEHYREQVVEFTRQHLMSVAV